MLLLHLHEYQRVLKNLASVGKTVSLSIYAFLYCSIGERESTFDFIVNACDGELHDMMKYLGDVA